LFFLSSLGYGDTGVSRYVPAAGIPVRLINYQGRVLAEGRTDPAGLVAFGAVRDAYFAYAESGADRAYLKLNESRVKGVLYR
jgi:hypothetical protein